MKLFNRIIIVFEALCALGFICCIINIFLTPSTSPEDILSVVDLKISNYNIEYESDNLDRGSSRFDNFTYNITFPQEEINTLIKQMQGGDWVKKDEIYEKDVDINSDLMYAAYVNPQLRTATLEVLIDEDYTLIQLFYAIPFILASALIAGLWGIVKLLSIIIKKKKT